MAETTPPKFDTSEDKDFSKPISNAQKPEGTLSAVDPEEFAEPEPVFGNNTSLQEAVK